MWDEGRTFSWKQSLGIQTDRQKFGLWLRLQRQSRRWTQDDLSERAGLSKAYLSRIEHGRVMPKEIALQKIHRALLST